MVFERKSIPIVAYSVTPRRGKAHLIRRIECIVHKTSDNGRLADTRISKENKLIPNASRTEEAQILFKRGHTRGSSFRCCGRIRSTAHYYVRIPKYGSFQEREVFCRTPPRFAINRYYALCSSMTSLPFATSKTTIKISKKKWPLLSYTSKCSSRSSCSLERLASPLTPRHTPYPIRRKLRDGFWISYSCYRCGSSEYHSYARQLPQPLHNRVDLLSVVVIESRPRKGRMRRRRGKVKTSIFVKSTRGLEERHLVEVLVLVPAQTPSV